jgi:phytoene synthase
MRNARSTPLEAAYDHCRRIALGHYENFPVGSILLPKAVRRHVYAVYAFARAADDFADEGALESAERLRRLDDWRARLDACLRGAADDPVFIALADTIARHRLPPVLFHDLLDAFTLDVKRSRHATFQELLNYSRQSANPIGRLMLLLFGFHDERLHLLSDDICTALQLTNFWQDISVDLEKDRMYLPQDDLAAFGYSENDLRARRHTPHFIRMMDALADRTQALFDRGKPLCAAIPGRLGFELRLVWLGGTDILAELRRRRYDVFTRRPVIGTRRKIALLVHSLAPSAFAAPPEARRALK